MRCRFFMHIENVEFLWYNDFVKKAPQVETGLL